MNSKKYLPLTLANILFISSLVFSQVENPYVSFNADALKSQKNYAKNFNIGDYNAGILYKCISDVVDAARLEFSFVDKMKHDRALDSAALMQASYMAKKDLKTEFNDAPYKTVYYRFKKYQLTHNGTELEVKVRAYVGEKEFSYYDVALDVVKSLLKSLKTAQVLLDKQYTFIGIGFDNDKNMKSLYAVITLGNDRTFDSKKLSKSKQEAPFTTAKNGLEFPDAKICNKCNNDKDLEVLSEYFSAKGNEIIINCDNAKLLRKLIGKDGDAIAFDFVQPFQYECSGNLVDNDRVNRGFMTKPMTYSSIIAKNTSTGKSNKITAVIGQIPDGVVDAKNFDLNILVIKESKYVCRTILYKAIETKGANYDNKLDFMMDETAVKVTGDWLPVPEETDIIFQIPMPDKKKTTFSLSDFENTIQHLNEPAYTVKKIDVIMRSPIHIVNDPTQVALQKKRATSITNALALKYPGIPVKVSYDDSWIDFQRDIVYVEPYYFLTFDKTEALTTLKANGGKVAKEIDSLLKKECYAEVILHSTYFVDESHVQKYAVTKFNRAICANQLSLAMSVENYIMKQVVGGKFDGSIADQLEIPELKEYQAFLNNQIGIQYKAKSLMDEETATAMRRVAKFNPANQVGVYNVTLCKVFQSKWKTVAEINALQAEIDRLYQQPTLPNDKVAALNLAFQVQILDFLRTEQSTPEFDNLRVLTVNKIKQLGNANDSWQNAYKLSKIFVNNYDYMYALSLMEPYIGTPAISEDFLFSYISIAAHREESFLSNQFLKAVKIANDKNPARLCGLFDRLPLSLMDNLDVKNIICKTCNR